MVDFLWWRQCGWICGCQEVLAEANNQNWRPRAEFASSQEKSEFLERRPLSWYLWWMWAVYHPNEHLWWQYGNQKEKLEPHLAYLCVNIISFWRMLLGRRVAFNSTYVKKASFGFVASLLKQLNFDDKRTRCGPRLKVVKLQFSGLASLDAWKISRANILKHNRYNSLCEKNGFSKSTTKSSSLMHGTCKCDDDNHHMSLLLNRNLRSRGRYGTSAI